MNAPISSLLLILTLLSVLTPSCGPIGPRTRALDDGATETIFTLPTRRSADAAASVSDLALLTAPAGWAALRLEGRPALALPPDEADRLAEALEGFDAWASARENRGLQLVREAARLGGDCGAVDVLYRAVPEGGRRVALHFRFPPDGQGQGGDAEVLLDRGQARAMAAALRAAKP